MKLGIHSYYDNFNYDGNLFNPEAFSIGHGLEKPFVALRDLAVQHGHRVESCNESNIDDFDGYIFLDLPGPTERVLTTAAASGKPCFLVILESEIIHNRNWDSTNYAPFRKVFSWNPVHNQKYGCEDLPLAQDLVPLENTPPLRDRKFACLMAGNKSSPDPRELYSARRQLIRWYESNAPQQFDLFGFGWDKRDFIFSERVRKYCPPLANLRSKVFTSFRGAVKQKRLALSNYQFNYCLENVRGIPGYVTEKIFDALAAGCIPVYHGDRSARDFVPQDCWIDHSQFRSPAALHRHLSGLSWEQKEELQARGRLFLRSQAAQRFSAGHFAATILRAVEERVG